MKISNNKFNNEEVILDFHQYEGCEFTNCRFIIFGHAPFGFNECSVNNCEFSFAGPAASTINTLATIYRSLGDQGKTLVEATFDQIRTAAANQSA